jgi:uncharacterized damage-inducible protein DinB
LTGRTGLPTVPVVQTGSETAVLKLMLAFQRLEMVRLASGLTDEQGRWRPHADANSIAELLSHLAWVERWWFDSVFSGGPDLSTDQRWPGFAASDGQSMGELIASYTSAWQRSNEVWDGACLDDEVETDHGPTSLRWIVVHMIEETARHAGHADITRQLIDGFRAS